MVNPSWGNFQKPNQNIPNEEKEFIQEFPGDLQDSEKPEKEKPQWGNFQSPNTYQGEQDLTADEDIFGYTIRNISANASRLGEQFLGRYGNMEKMGKDILTNYPKTGGVIGWALSELMGPERWERMVKGVPGRQQQLPTSQQLKEFSEKATGGYTKPKTPGEERFQEVTEDIGSTISGRTFENPTLRNIGLNNLLIPAASNVTKEIVEDLGFGKDKANMAKIAVWIPFSLAANVNANQFAANLMNQGRQGFGPNVVANIPRYQNRMNQVGRGLLHADPRSELAREQLTGINNDIANGQTSMRDLMIRYDAINAAKRNRRLFELNSTDRRAAIHNIDQVRNAVREEIVHLGQVNPQALHSWENGVNAFSTIHRSNAITNWIQGIAKGPYAKILTAPAAGLFGIGTYAGIKAPIVALPTSVGIPYAYKTGTTIYRMFNNEHLANYYWRAIGEAQAENIPAFINNYNKLNEKLEKLNSTEKKAKPKK